MVFVVENTLMIVSCFHGVVRCDILMPAPQVDHQLAVLHYRHGCTDVPVLSEVGGERIFDRCKCGGTRAADIDLHWLPLCVRLTAPQLESDEIVDRFPRLVRIGHRAQQLDQSVACLYRVRSCLKRPHVDAFARGEVPGAVRHQKAIAAPKVPAAGWFALSAKDHNAFRDASADGSNNAR